MKRSFTIIVPVLVLSFALAATVFAAGEGILAQTGQYTFFIKPCPGTHITYYQRLVPCVVEETIMVPRTVVETFPVPVPRRQHQAVLVTETPVGCAMGQGPCTTCWPQPIARTMSQDVWAPQMMPTRVPGYEFVPKTVTKRVLLPQWFRVTEEPKPMQKVRKVGSEG
jgi:hypothetical protein